MKRIGRPRTSTTAWTLVPNPPRERPEHGLERLPFYPCSGRQGLGTDHGRIYCQPLDIRIIRHSLENPVDHTLLDPAIITALGRLIRPELLRQITPTTARTRQPQQRIQKMPAIAARATLALASARHKIPQPLPLIVPKNFTSQASLQKPALKHKSYPR